MEIYVVKSGDTLKGVADIYGVDLTDLAADNGLEVSSELVVGQALAVQIPETVHTVVRGETIASIAKNYDTTAIAILRNNFKLGGSSKLDVGEKIVIKYSDNTVKRSVDVNSYAYPYIKNELLRKQLPYLTYFTPFTYGIGNTGGLIVPDDYEMVKAAKEYGVRTLLHLSTLTESGEFSSEQASLIFSNDEYQRNLINEIISVAEQKGYGGVDVDFEFIKPEERFEYITFLQEMRIELEEIGLPLFSALAPKTSDNQVGVLYEGHDYAGIAAAVNYVLLMTYEWGYTYGPPMAVAPLPNVRQVVEYALTRVSSSKIFFGIPTYGYDWVLPYERGSGVGAPSISPVEAINIARRYNADIRYDTSAQAPWFIYSDDDGRLHEVWFEDVRSISAKFKLADEYGLFGIGYWNSMRDFPQNWVTLNSNYNIRNYSLL